MDIARAARLPLMLMTPTRRVNVESLARSAYAKRNVIADCCAFLRDVRASRPADVAPILVGGLLGCRGNAYRGDEGLSRADAVAFHQHQVRQFMHQSMDFLFAGIMPTVAEAIGMAEAMSRSGIPYVISFMIRNSGRLLDGTPLAEAIEMIDHAVCPQPVCYMANCIHPVNLKQALLQDVNVHSPYLSRFRGIQANASSRSPEELDQNGELQQEDAAELVQHMRTLHTELGLNILGGCCGTDDGFLAMVAQFGVAE